MVARRMKIQTQEERKYIRRYRRHRCLAGRIYEQLGDLPEDRESFVQRAENGLEGNFQRNMTYIQEQEEALFI